MSMFDQKENRVDYGEILTADPDYELDQAVGLTYSLDMEALMGIPLCLGMGGEITTGQINNPLYVLEAIRRTGKKLSIFCNAGSIKVPKKESKLFALLENSIHEVRLTSCKYNFHPKLWVLQYHNIYDGRILIKVVVLSRNLTFDQSLDIATEMSGFVGNRVLKKNKPLADMVSFVSQYDESNSYDNLISNINRIKDFDIDNLGCFKKCAFHSFGIYGKDENGVKRIPENNKSDARKMFSDCNSLFIISPFLTESIIDYIMDNYGSNENNGPYRRCLITRESSVNSRILEAMNKRNGDGVWIIDPVISSNEALDDGDTYGYADRDIHAKVYYTEKDNEPHKLFIGSMNASNNAFNNNVEFLLELQYKKSYTSYQKIKNEFLPEKENPFIHLDIVPEINNDNSENQVDFREEVYSIRKAEIIKIGDSYSIKIFCDYDFENITIRPFYVKNDIQQLLKITEFKNIPINSLSNMFVLKKGDSECLVRLEVEGMPEDEREDAIFNQIIKNNNLFMTYMRYLLDEDFYDSVSYEELLRNANENDCEPSLDYGFSVEPDIYEKMLKAASDNPERFDAMYEIAERLENDRTGVEFMQLLDLFMKASGRKGKG